LWSEKLKLSIVHGQLLKKTALLFGLALSYYVAGRLGLRLAFVNASATAVWPPTGIAIGALLVLGLWSWPAIFVGALLVNLHTSGSVPASLGIALGNTLEGVLGAFLIQRYAHGQNVLSQPVDIFKFTLLSGLSTTVSASIGALSLMATGLAGAGAFGSVWMTWWLGDFTGALIVAPAVLSWANTGLPLWRLEDLLDATLLFGSVFVTAMLVFGGWFPSPVKTYPLEFLCIPLVIWAAFRFGPRAIVTTTLIFSGVAIGGTLHGDGPFINHSQNTSLLLLQLFTSVITLTGMTVGAVLSGRRSAQEALRRHEEQLEHLVEERTEELHLKDLELLQTRKLEAIGRLAGGVAHDFNNLLTGIMGSCEILENDFPKNTVQQEEVREIRKAADRATALTRQLLAFGRKQIMTPRVMNLNQAVEDLSKILGRLIGEDVHLVTELDPDLGAIKADPVQLDQVLLNLAANARDAMPQGGKLMIQTSNSRWEAGDPQTELKAGNYVVLAITDTGVGMSQEVAAQIFEPFYTTKERGRGTGLGLATVYGIVKQLGGAITIYSRPEYGSTFKIFLPRFKEVPADKSAAQDKNDSANAPGGSETILVVEDDDLTAKQVARILRRKGYTLLTARNGIEAIDLIKVTAGPVHLVLTDVIMPIMNGRQLADRLVAGRPALRVIYMSGYPEEVISQHGVLNPGTAFIEKPFYSAKLLEKVRAVLDHPT
jgi:signal transduction histidine kinase/CheY-like chemotaxis protein